MIDDPSLPIAVVGAGPVGLAAAAELATRRLPFRVLEKSPSVAAAPRAFGHVRLFTPWRYATAAAAERLLAAGGWRAPDPEAIPTGADLVARYLEPLARHPAIAGSLVPGAEVTAIGRAGLDKVAAERHRAPFTVRWRDGSGALHAMHARAVIDASGTLDRPGPMGVDGLSVEGEAQVRDLIAYGIPDTLGVREAWEGRRVLVVGSGHSAINVVLDLLRLKAQVPATRILWAIRRPNIDRLVGGGPDDELPERGALGTAASAAIASGAVELLAPFAAERVVRSGAGARVEGRLGDAGVVLDVDRIVVATGFRPDLSILRELRVALDPALEAPPALAPLIDPNLHSCGTVPPHGAAELAHPEPGFFIVGSKSYGRAPTFLMATGYEQVRSVVAELAGDRAAAREVRLVLPKTGVCGAPAAAANAAGCCGGPARTAEACCVADEVARARGKGGCGCAPARVGEAV